MSSIEDLVRDELRKLHDDVAWQVQDPAVRAALAQMTADLATIPIRMARGEDVTSLVAALKAEGVNRALAHRINVEAAAHRAWINVLQRILFGVVTG